MEFGAAASPGKSITKVPLNLKLLVPMVLVFMSQSRAWTRDMTIVAIVCHRQTSKSGNEQSYNVMEILYTLTCWFLPFLNKKSPESWYFRQAPSKSGQEREMETHCC